MMTTTTSTRVCYDDDGDDDVDGGGGGAGAARVHVCTCYTDPDRVHSLSLSSATHKFSLECVARVCAHEIPLWLHNARTINITHALLTLFLSHTLHSRLFTLFTLACGRAGRFGGRTRACCFQHNDDDDGGKCESRRGVSNVVVLSLMMLFMSGLSFRCCWYVDEKAAIFFIRSVHDAMATNNNNTLFEMSVMVALIEIVRELCCWLLQSSLKAQHTTHEK